MLTIFWEVDKVAQPFIKMKIRNKSGHKKNRRFLNVRSKSAQMQMTETIAVIFIFFVLVLFGLIFYFKYQQVALKEEQQELLGARAMDTTLQALFMPELICSRGNAEPEDNCFDMLKVASASGIFQEHLTDYYFNLFGYANISIQPIYPQTQEAFILYDKPKPEFISKEPTFFVVTLRNDLETEGLSTYGFGYLIVEVYD